MAADSRENASSGGAQPESTVEKTQRKQNDASAVPVAPESANMLPAAAGQNTAGAKLREAGILDALKSINFNEFQEVHKKPCVRDAFLTGIGGGFGIGGVRAIWGGTQHSSLFYGSKYSTDNFSDCVVELQLGCWFICFRLVSHA